MRDVIEDPLRRIAVEERRVGFGTTIDALRFYRAETLGTPDDVREPGAFLVRVGASAQALTAATIERRAGP
jgi:hypothetical protein